MNSNDKNFRITVDFKDGGVVIKTITAADWRAAIDYAHATYGDPIMGTGDAKRVRIDAA